MTSPYYTEEIEFKISLPRSFFLYEDIEDPENEVLFDISDQVKEEENWLDQYPDSVRNILIKHGKSEEKDPRNREFNRQLLESYLVFDVDWYKSSLISQVLVWNEEEKRLKEIWHEYRFSGLYNFISFHDFCIVRKKLVQNYFAREYLKRYR